MAEAMQSQEQNKTYAMDQESSAEMSRLQRQGAAITQAMGGLLTEISDLSQVQRILDVACGPGDWAYQLALSYPQLDVVGIDISHRMISYANSRKLPNTTYLVMDILQPLSFPDESFDVINARLLQAVVPKKAWIPFLKECQRILKPGGIIRLTEQELALSNSLAGETFGGLTNKAFYMSGQGFSPNGNDVCITAVLTSLLRDVGYSNVQQKAFVLDGSAEAPFHEDFRENGRLGGLLIQPFLIKLGLATEKELLDLYQQAQQDMRSPDFRAIWFFLTAWGKKAIS